MSKVINGQDFQNPARFVQYAQKNALEVDNNTHNIT